MSLERSSRRLLKAAKQLPTPFASIEIVLSQFAAESVVLKQALSNFANAIREVETELGPEESRSRP